jgi:hypothetical protein
MGANPTIHCDGRNVHVVIQGVSCVKEGKSDGGLGGQEIQALPGHIPLVGVDFNQDGLSFGVATARFQCDVELELLGDDVAEWLPDRNDDKGLQWMTGGTKEAMLRTRQHEKERAREKDQLNAIMVPGGIDGLERSQRDPATCRDEQQLLASFHWQMLLVPFSTFLYNSPAALARRRDCKIRQRRLTQTLVFGVTQDLLYAAQGADAAGARFIDANRPMPPQSVVRRYVDLSAPSKQCAQHTKIPSADVPGSGHSGIRAGPWCTSAWTLPSICPSSSEAANASLLPSRCAACRAI